MENQLKLNNQLCFRVYSLHKTITKRYAEILAPLQLTYPQYLVMLVLWQTKNAISVNELGEQLALDSGTLSPLLKRMANANLVERNRDQVDERKVVISLTAHGKQLKQKAKLIPEKMFQQTGLTMEEFQSLTGLLDKVKHNVAS